MDLVDPVVEDLGGLLLFVAVEHGQDELLEVVHAQVEDGVFLVYWQK